MSIRGQKNFKRDIEMRAKRYIKPWEGQRNNEQTKTG